MDSHVERAYAFLDRADMAGERTESSSVGTAVFDDNLPRRLDSNFLRVERETDPETVREEAERLGRRMVFVPDPELGERVVPYFKERGWRINRVVVMAQLREPERTGDLSLVTEVEEPALRAARHQVVTGQPWASPEIMAQLFAGKELIGRRVQARFFAVVVDGEVVSYTDLYQDGTEAQVEDVGTLHEHRGRGYASAVVLAAIAEARKHGAEFVFLVADYEDWPKELYRRLGFDELGYYVKFIAPHT
ncbi:MAG: GNAT family N-acetyltransferase [Actinobacteria bacterium]|nr:MAG: GNAT family N-acetyltransferase [Actinomycetota bacterium]